MLTLAEDAGRPLLERVKFLAIFSRNLDEFFQVRVSGLQELPVMEKRVESPDGLTASEQLALIRARVEEVSIHAQEVWSKQLRPALRDAGIDRRRREDLELVQTGFDSAPDPVNVSMAGFGGGRPQRPGPRTPIPAALKYALAVSR